MVLYTVILYNTILGHPSYFATPVETWIPYTVICKTFSIINSSFNNSLIDAHSLHSSISYHVPSTSSISLLYLRFLSVTTLSTSVMYFFPKMATDIAATLSILVVFLLFFLFHKQLVTVFFYTLLTSSLMFILATVCRRKQRKCLMRRLMRRTRRNDREEYSRASSQREKSQGKWRTKVKKADTLSSILLCVQRGGRNWYMNVKNDCENQELS